MRPEIAIIGAGITGIMTALACARKGAVVDLYDAENIPNTGNLSWASGRLWKHIHEHNGSLEPLALASLPYWEALIMRSGGELGCRTESLRLLPLNDSLELERHYRARGSRCYIQEPQASEQSQVFRFSTDKHLFIGCDAVLLNARKICQQLLDELTQCRNVTLRPVTPVNLTALANGRLSRGSVETDSTQPLFLRQAGHCRRGCLLYVPVPGFTIRFILMFTLMTAEKIC